MSSVAPKKEFFGASPSVSRPSLEADPMKTFKKSVARKSGCEWCKAPIFEGGYK